MVTRGTFAHFCQKVILLLLPVVLVACKSEFHAKAKPAPGVVSAAAAAPTLTYTLMVAGYPINSAMATNSPVDAVLVGDVYTVNPALPAGLSIDVNNGDITGTPVVITPAAVYVVTRTRGAETLDGSLTITINDEAPAGLSYSYNAYSWYNGEGITNNTPTNIGGTITNYSISPALPTGVSIDPTTGIISGTPTVTSALTTYTVTGSNVSGSTTYDMDLRVGTVGECLTPNPIAGWNFGGGYGTAAVPWTICTADYFDDMRAITTSGQFFELTQNIDLTAYASGPMVTGDPCVLRGCTAGSFQGTLDGNGFAFQNLSLVGGGSFDQGLFVGTISANIHDLGISDFTSTGYSQNVGLLVGKCVSSTFTDITISGTNSLTATGASTGGICGLSNTNSFTNITVSNLTLTNGSNEGAGISGSSTTDTFTNVTLSGTGSITAPLGSAGGIAGVADGSTFTGAHVTGTYTILGDSIIGGIVGQSSTSTISNSHNVATITANGVTNGYVGGIVGFEGSGGTIAGSYNTGTITGLNYVGGVAGYMAPVGATITNCYNQGNVSDQATGDYVGGIVGSSSGNIQYTYNTGFITANGANFGAISGQMQLGATIHNSFWRDNTFAISDPASQLAAGVYMKTLLDMSGSAIFIADGWDFTTPIWKAPVSVPQLNWEP